MFLESFCELFRKFPPHCNCTHTKIPTLVLVHNSFFAPRPLPIGSFSISLTTTSRPGKHYSLLPQSHHSIRFPKGRDSSNPVTRVLLRSFYYNPRKRGFPKDTGSMHSKKQNKKKTEKGNFLASRPSSNQVRVYESHMTEQLLALSLRRSVATAANSGRPGMCEILFVARAALLRL